MLINHDAEKSVIGAILQDETAASIAMQKMVTSDFDKPEHQAIFTAVCSTRAAKLPVDVSTVSNELAKAKLNHSAYMLNACRYVPTTANAEAYIKIVLECSRNRTAYKVLRESSEKLASGMADLDEVSMLVANGLKGTRSVGKKTTFRAAMERTFELFENATKGNNGAIPFGIAPLDRITGGIKPGQYIVMAGLPGCGKSAFASDIAVHAMLKGKRATIITQEMTEEQYMQRIWSSRSGVDMQRIIDGDAGDGDMECLMDTVDSIANYGGDFISNVKSVEEACGIVEADLPDLVILDYMQLMPIAGTEESATARMSHISRTIKNLAHDTRVPVIAISSLSRVKEGRVKTMPQQKDLRGSGEIEYDADMIIFLHTPEAESDPYVREEDKGLFNVCKRSEGAKKFISVNVDKNKQGRTGWFSEIFEPSIMRFTQIDRSK
ncbi:MAG TPA: DnaB-like helicase C-terminal domain-containing protein [Bacillota bacterium]|nr:DnaB-like helicase C-terminal domain-containing protein [Bacillota bacterium]